MPRRGLLLLPVVLFGVEAAACAADDHAPEANRFRPLHAQDVGEEGALGGPPVTWVHYHGSWRNAADVRGVHEPQAPDGSRVPVISSVPGCDCSERALRLLTESELPDPAEVPAVCAQVQGRTVWAWIPEARPGWAYRIHLQTEPPGLTIADPVAEITHGQVARFPLHARPREVRVRIVAVSQIRYMEVLR